MIVVYRCVSLTLKDFSRAITGNSNLPLHFLNIKMVVKVTNKAPMDIIRMIVTVCDEKGLLGGLFASCFGVSITKKKIKKIIQNLDS